MQVKITDTEMVALGYDISDVLDAEPSRRAIIKKCRGRKAELTIEESEVFKSDVSTLASFGTDPQCAATATRLRKKAGFPF